ncbi:hypothetical protein VFPPC_03426 [Pochonia chlamydosporia 170]|uniref:CorA-like mg2+ transporter protein domain-containing protein n=1 Tax=Pochonia chlamydosporia 170 TaxID=1380566 RepID=A0A179FZJ1_METCM|nr:hypothetical protein VFPPC_03426 [Pochonia chlamydosporia 170]OAQ71064.1 hypothetical protein VFPPC_03426 [Pochonia chlamydosporia 170]
MEELRTELLAGESTLLHGRMLVLRTSHIDDVVRETLANMAGVDGEFLDAHVLGRPYRPRAGNRRPRWWTWKYPEVAARGNQIPLYRPGDGQVLTISRMSIWLGGNVPILLVGHNAVLEKRDKKTKLKHEDAVVASGYGATGYTFPSSNQRTEMSSFEEDLWETLISLTGTHTPIEEILADMIHDRWTACLSAMRLEIHNADQEQKSLWRAMAALEQNLDEAKYLSRKGSTLDAVCPSAWEHLIARLEMRIHLRQPAVDAAMRRRQTFAQTSRTDNDRSLDRIAYLGGMLLPVTVVASVLAIEGDYGPEGGNFWVFWVSSFVASVLAVLVIYADQLRTVEVWLEIGDVDEEDLRLPEDGGGGWEDAARYLVQRWTDGEGGRTWKRGELGWGGAVKKMSGYYWWRRDPRLAFQRPGDVVRTKGL